MTHTVLVVEDDEALRDTMRDVLELNGYPVVVAVDGQQALDRLAAIEDLGLILLDLLMPNMNGWDFLRALRGRPALAGVPVVVHSSWPTDVPPGVARVLRKPASLSRLLSVVAEFCAA